MQETKEIRGGSPGVIFLHSSVSGPESFEEEARELARAGVKCLLLRAPWAREPWRSRPRGLSDPEGERALWEQTALEVSQAVDELIGARGVDPARIGFVGRNLGGGVGGYALTKEPRVRAAVFTGAIPDLSRFWAESDHATAARARRSGTDPSRYIEVMGALDLRHSLKRLEWRSVLLQFGTRDDWIVRAHAEEAFAGALEPKTIQWLDDDHDMNSAESLRARREWLLHALAAGQSRAS